VEGAIELREIDSIVVTETTEPLSVIVGPEVIRRFNVREQRFLFGRAALAVADNAGITMAGQVAAATGRGTVGSEASGSLANCWASGTNSLL